MEDIKTYVFSTFLQLDDLQWLGWNWLKARVGLLIGEGENVMKSRKQIYLEMLQQNFEYFPSL